MLGATTHWTYTWSTHWGSNPKGSFRTQELQLTGVRSYNLLTCFWGSNLLFSTHEAPFLIHEAATPRLVSDARSYNPLNLHLFHPRDSNPKGLFCVYDFVMQVLQHCLCSVSMLCHMQIIITHVLFTIQYQSCIMFTHSKPHVLIHRLTTHYLNSTYHLLNYNCIVYITTTAGNTILQIYLNYTPIFISYYQFLFIFLITWTISIIFSHLLLDIESKFKHI
jgi:hypothetical protein